MPITRLDFLKLSSVAATASAVPFKKMLNKNKIFKTTANGAVAIASANGLKGVELAYKLMTEEAADPLDAAIEGVKINELDPEDMSVGLGGLPNENGVVQLDASCMHGPSKRAGSVAALEDIATPALVAKAVMDYTNHIMLAGADAKKFATDLGFKEQNLMTERSREAWLRWRSRRSQGDNWLNLRDQIKTDWTSGTVHMSAMDLNGDLASVTSTSGISYKVPGRVGDSPIIGAGQYCDNNVGTAGSTGRGESVIKICGSFYIVEQMKAGASPEEACYEAIQRVIESTEDRLLVDGMPTFNLEFYALHKSGEFGGVRLYAPPGGRAVLAAANADGARHETIPHIYEYHEIPDPESDLGVPDEE